MSVALGGMTPPAPRSPYANSGGMVSVALPPARRVPVSSLASSPGKAAGTDRVTGPGADFWVKPPEDDKKK